MWRLISEAGVAEPVEIQYREFYDFPRMFVAVHNGVQYLFDGSFSDELDDYPDEYQVFVLPGLTRDQLSGSWATLRDLASRRLGSIPIRHVLFDSTRRQSVDAAAFRPFATRATA